VRTKLILTCLFRGLESRVDCVLCGAAEVVLIGYDARWESAQLTNQLDGVWNKTLLMSGRQSSVRHSVGVLFGFIVGLSSSPSPVSSVGLQLWRPLGHNNYQLVCQQQVTLAANISRPAHEVQHSYHTDHSNRSPSVCLSV